LNEEFQKIARRDKQAFLSDQCKEIESNNRMVKNRYLFKKIRDTKGLFHAKMGTIKDRNGMDPTEAEDIKKMWQEYKELHKRCLFHYWGLKCKSRKSRDTWSNRQIWPWSTKQNRAKANSFAKGTHWS